MLPPSFNTVKTKKNTKERLATCKTVNKQNYLTKYTKAAKLNQQCCLITFTIQNFGAYQYLHVHVIL